MKESKLELFLFAVFSIFTVVNVLGLIGSVVTSNGLAFGGFLGGTILSSVITWAFYSSLTHNNKDDE